MTPMSLLNLSPEVLQAAHARDQDQRHDSPHGERGERSYAQVLGIALMLVPLAVLLTMLH